MGTPVPERKVRVQQLSDLKENAQGSGRVYEQTQTQLLGSLQLVYRSWTRSKVSTGNRIAHKALLTVDGLLIAKLEWCWTRLDAERIEREQAEVSLFKSAITATLMHLHGSSTMGLQYNSWDLLTLMTAFCIHYGPKGQRYCLLDFVAGHERAFALTTMRVLSRKFLTTKRIDAPVDIGAAAAAAAAVAEVAPIDGADADADASATDDGVAVASAATQHAEGRSKMRVSRDPAPDSPIAAAQE